ncbi:hypothetical protein JCM3770_005496 [Rhodotorula araucariae]
MSTPPPYLLPGFDSSRAKVAELRGILLAHDVPYNAVAKKPQLVALFEQHIRPQAPVLLADFRAVRASADGVLDGESQGSSLRELDTEPDEEPAPARATTSRVRTRKSLAAAAAAATVSSSSSTSTRGSKAKAKGKARAVRAREDSGDEDEDASMDEPEEVQPAVKKRDRARKTVRAATPPDAMDVDDEEDLYEAPKEYEAPIRVESEDDDDDDLAAPPPTLSPKKRKEPATPRLSDLVKKADSPSDGNFSDFNPFQSGGEETPQRDTKRRKSSIGPSRLRETGEVSSSRLSPRKSLPATLPTHRRDPQATGPWAASPASSSRPRASVAFDVAPAAEEDVPAVPPVPSSARAKQRASLGVASTSGTPIGVKYMVPVAKVKTTPPQVAEMLRQHQEAHAQSAPVSPAKRVAPSTGRIAGPSPQTRRKSSSPVEDRAAKSARTVRQVAGQGKQLAADVIHLKEPARGSEFPSLASLRRAGLVTLLVLSLAYIFWRRDEIVAAGYCDTGSTANTRIEARRTSLALPALPDLPPAVTAFADAWGMRPGCTPCPTHGHCVDGAFVGCTLDHVPVQPSALRTLGGWIPAASICVPDTAKQVAIARQASAGAHLLRRRRGDVICRGLEKARRRDARTRGAGEHDAGEHDAFVFGMDAVAVLDELARANELAPEPVNEDVIDEINRLALRDLEAHGEVLVWQNGEEYWYASRTAEMSYGCQARLFAKNWVREHKLPLSSLLAAVFGVFWLRHKLAQRKRDEVRKDQLVAIALHQLQQQARSHFADPVHIPFAHVAPSHLRDLVLQDEHSPARRAALWKRVAHVVEGNANVRVKDVEVNGEELRGWEWTGPMAGAAAIEPAERPAMREGGKTFPSLPQSPVLARG